MSQNLLGVWASENQGSKSDWFELLAAQTATQATRTSDLQACLTSPGVMLEIITNAENGSPTFTPKILVPDGAGGADIVIASFTAISSSGVTILVLHPSASDLGTEDKVGTLPKDWKLELTYAGADTGHYMDTHVYARYI